MFLLPLFKALNIHSHTYSLDFCLYKLKMLYSILRAPPRGPTLYLTFQCLLGSEFSLEAKRGCDGWVLRRICSALQGNCFTGGHYGFIGILIILRGRWDSCIYGQKRLEVLEIHCPQSHQDLPIWPHSSLQNSISSQSIPHFTSRYSVRFGIQFVL